MVLYVPDHGRPEVQGAGSERYEAGKIALNAAEGILGVAIFDAEAQEWIGDTGGRVIVREVEFEYPVERGAE